MNGVTLRRAVASDAGGVAACVCEAYLPTVERIGRQQAPMLEDYLRVIAEAEVHVAIRDERVVGVVVLKDEAGDFTLDNVAVRAPLHGSGLGRALLELAEAEARRAGHAAIQLYTHELMTEDRALYAGIGYREVARRVVDGYARVFIRKELA